MKPSEILDGAAALCERGWCQRVPAKDIRGQSISLSSDGAVQWCPEGAMCRVALFENAAASRAAAQKYIQSVLGRSNVWGWNDNAARTQAEVVAKLHEAAELARSEGQ